MQKLDKIILTLAFVMIAVGGWCTVRAALSAPYIVLDVCWGIAIGLVASGVIIKAIGEDRKYRERQKRIIERVREMIKLEDEE